MVITVNFEDGGITRFTLNPAEQHEGKSCGTVEHVEISESGLVWSPRVLSAISGEVRLPTLALDVKSVSETPPPVCCSLGTKTTTTTEFYESDYRDEFILIPITALAAVTEVNVDGVLAYARDDRGRLVCPASGVADTSNSDGIESVSTRRTVEPNDWVSPNPIVEAARVPDNPSAEEYLRHVLGNIDF